MKFTYRQLQQKLKVLRNTKKIDKSVKLNQKKVELQSIFNKYNNNIILKNFKKRGTKNKIKSNHTSTIKLDDKNTIKDIILNLNETATRYPIVSYNGVSYALTNKNRIDFFKNIENDIIDDEADQSDKDFINLINNQNLEQIQIQWRDKMKNIRKNKGNFFEYTHKILNMDFSRYGLFDHFNSYNYQNSCFIQALIHSAQLTDNEINEIRRICITEMVEVKDLKIISEKYNIGFIINSIKLYNHNENRIIKVNDDKEKVVKMGLINNHFFINDKETYITSFALNNYEDVKDIPNYNKINKINNKGKYNKSNTNFIDSLQLFKILTRNKELFLDDIYKNDDFLNKYQNVKSDIYKKSVDNLYFDKSNCELIKYEPKNKPYSNIFFFDFETTTNEATHIPYLICYDELKQDEEEKDEEAALKNIKSHFGEQCGLSFLCEITKNKTKGSKLLCIAHNLGYDIKFLLQYLNIMSITNKSNSIVFFVQAMFKGVKIDFKCSYAMIPLALRAFPKAFGLSSIKEIMPYSIYTSDSVNLKSIDIQNTLKIIKDEDKVQFIQNIKKWDCECEYENEKHFDHIKYSLNYCKFDVLVLKNGYSKFKKFMFEITGLNVNDYATIASISDAYLKKSLCYKKCYMYSGNIQKFIMKSIVGGRTMCRNNEKIHTKIPLADLDAVSLYPSAMHRLDGFLKGKPCIIPDQFLNYESLQKFSGYYVKINITKINKYLNFPLINKKDDNGIRQFSNELLGIHYVDNITLQDYIDFQEIEYDIICGYYFNDGHNKTIKKVISNLFNERLKMKKIGNPIQNVYKLLMNSGYGKTIMRPIEQTTHIIAQKDYNKFMDNNIHKIILWYKIENTNKEKTEIDNTKYIFKCNKSINDHFNIPHIGSHILSMSKRIMNETMVLAENNNINIFYQDTDSMHIENDKIKDLEFLYKEKYNKELVGNDLGQFNNDFDFEHDKGTEIYASESYFLGKKCYIDKVMYFKDNQKKYSYHIRMKGIGSKAIIFEANKDDSKYKGDSMELFKDLYNNKQINFNLLDDTTKVMFKSDKHFNVASLKEFERKIQFIGKKTEYL